MMEPGADKPAVSKTKDGSTTLYSPKFDQYYHNPNGAVSESRIVFFETPGILSDFEQRERVTIFEMGFGTGLNLMLLKHYLNRLNSPAKVTYYSVEAFPVHPETAANFDFGEELSETGYNKLLPQIFENAVPGLNTFHIDDNLTLKLFIGSFDNMTPPEIPIDYFFHDPFSPEVNKELWTPEVFKTLMQFATESAKLSTYCAATKARAAMAVAGWKIAKAPGALGKREMTVASVTEENLTGFKRVNEQRLAMRYERGDFD